MSTDQSDAGRAGNDSGNYVNNYEDVSAFELSDEREYTLLNNQTECTFMWTTSTGDPVGVIMNFVHHDGIFWLTCARRRKRVSAILDRPRVAVAVSSRGTGIGTSQALTYKGIATVLDDERTRIWMYRTLAAKVRPGNAGSQAAFIRHLDSPGRIVIRVDTDTRIGFDSEAMFAGSPASPTTTNL